MTRSIAFFFVVVLSLAVSSTNGFTQSSSTTHVVNQTMSLSQLAYFDSATVLKLHFALPATFGVTSGTDTARTIVAYSERFSSPYKTTYVDSVTVAMAIHQLDTVPGNAIAIEAFPAYTAGGHWYPDFSSNGGAALDAGIIVPGEEAIDTLIPYAPPFLYHHALDTTFFITVEVPDVAHAMLWLYSDSVTSKTALPIDESLDRSRLLLNQPYQGYYQYYMAGTQWQFDPTLYVYPNFVMIAHISTPTGSVADLYPVNVDPLTFFVERTAIGETILHYTLPAESGSDVQLDLYDRTGRKVQMLASAFETAGEHIVPLTDNSLVSGMYYARLVAAGYSQVRPVVIVK